MQNFKYHLLTVVSVLFFSYILAYTINGITRHSLIVMPSAMLQSKLKQRSTSSLETESIDSLVESGFFRVALMDNGVESENSFPSGLDDLLLLGTVTGPANIAVAMIQKKGEKNAGIFSLWKDVYGYQLIAINTNFVYLKHNSERYKIELYEKKTGVAGASSGAAPSGQSNLIKSSLSKAEFQQNVMNNIDNAMRGIRAGPYRENGVVEGYRLISVRPFNILYKYGIRSGDIVKRINGKKIDSTEKLFTMWQGITDESKMTADIDRNGQIVTIEINITD